MEILGARILIRPVDPERTLTFYRDVLGLAIAREFPGGTVFFLGGGFLEVSGTASEPAGDGVASSREGVASSREGVASSREGVAPSREGVALWMQVRDLDAAYRDLAEHVVREPRVEPWGLHEMWVADPDGTRIVLVQVPPDHPIRRDTRD